MMCTICNSLFHTKEQHSDSIMFAEDKVLYFMRESIIDIKEWMNANCFSIGEDVWVVNRDKLYEEIKKILKEIER